MILVEFVVAFCCGLMTGYLLKCLWDACDEGKGHDSL